MLWPSSTLVSSTNVRGGERLVRELQKNDVVLRIFRDFEEMVVAHSVAVSAQRDDEILRRASVALAFIFDSGVVHVRVRHHVLSIADNETRAEQLGLWLTGGIESANADDAQLHCFDG